MEAQRRILAWVCSGSIVEEVTNVRPGVDTGIHDEVCGGISFKAIDIYISTSL